MSHALQRRLSESADSSAIRHPFSIALLLPRVLHVLLAHADQGLERLGGGLVHAGAGDDSDVAGFLVAGEVVDDAGVAVPGVGGGDVADLGAVAFDLEVGEAVDLAGEGAAEVAAHVGDALPAAA